MWDDEFDLIMEAIVQVCLARHQHGKTPSCSARIRTIADRLEESARRLAEEEPNALALGFADLLRQTYGNDAQSAAAGDLSKEKGRE